MNENKTLKTRPSQRKAVEEYRKKHGNKYSTISICLTLEEKEEHKKLLKAKGKTPLEVWRDAMQRLKDE